MIWGNVWAWAGLAGVALPVLIHLLARGQARVQRFPSLRFLEASRLLPTRRTRLHDLPLLAVRIAIVVAAAAAMAQPLILTAHRSQALGAPLVRAIVVDTSTSMRRATPTGEAAFDVAQRTAARLRDSSSTSVVLETADPAGAIAGAAQWLLDEPWRGELDIVSDFQTGAVDSLDLAAVPRRLGIRLSRVDVRRDTTAGFVIRASDAEIVANATPRGADTEVRWAKRGQTTTAPVVATFLASDDAHAGVEAAQRAAATVGVRLPVDTSRSIEILYPGAPTAEAVLRAATLPRAPWMTALVARLRSDSMLIDAAAGAAIVGQSSVATDSANAHLVVARTASGRPVVTAAQPAEPSESLVLISHADAGSLLSAALIAAVTRAQSAAPASTELDPSVVPDNVLASWQRAPSPADVARANGVEGPSDARWLWIMALLLIAVESWMRRRSAARALTTAAAAPGMPERTRVA